MQVAKEREVALRNDVPNLVAIVRPITKAIEKHGHGQNDTTRVEQKIEDSSNPYENWCMPPQQSRVLKARNYDCL